jgi:hypothetical protein
MLSHRTEGGNIRRQTRAARTTCPPSTQTRTVELDALEM